MEVRTSCRSARAASVELSLGLLLRQGFVAWNLAIIWGVALDCRFRIVALARMDVVAGDCMWRAPTDVKRLEGQGEAQGNAVRKYRSVTKLRC